MGLSNLSGSGQLDRGRKGRRKPDLEEAVVELFGEELTRREVAARSGALSQFAGVRLMTLGDGLERGIRMLEFRTGTGLRFTVLIDRAMDIGDCDHKGLSIGWHS